MTLFFLFWEGEGYICETDCNRYKLKIKLLTEAASSHITLLIYGTKQTLQLNVKAFS